MAPLTLSVVEGDGGGAMGGQRGGTGGVGKDVSMCSNDVRLGHLLVHGRGRAEWGGEGDWGQL